jgi:CRP-like cAMP-binding protein
MPIAIPSGRRNPPAPRHASGDVSPWQYAGQKIRALEGKCGDTVLHYSRGELIFGEGEESDSIFYVLEGRLKLSVHSQQGKEALLNILGPGDFIGVVSLKLSNRGASATALTDCKLVRLSVPAMRRLLRDDWQFCEAFMEGLLLRARRVHLYLADQLLRTTEQRLARVLFRLADAEDGQLPNAPISGVSHEMLASLVGTTRPRISHFMNKFRRAGLIEYSADRIRVKPKLREIADGN